MECDVSSCVVVVVVSLLYNIWVQIEVSFSSS